MLSLRPVLPVRKCHVCPFCPVISFFLLSFFNPSIHPSIDHSFIHLSIHLSFLPSLFPSFHPLIHQFIHLSIHPSIYPLFIQKLVIIPYKMPRTEPVMKITVPTPSQLSVGNRTQLHIFCALQKVLEQGKNRALYLYLGSPRAMMAWMKCEG